MLWPAKWNLKNLKESFTIIISAIYVLLQSNIDSQNFNAQKDSEYI